MIYDAVLLLAALTSGVIASVAGFGIGSLLTPVLALHVETKTAVAAVSIPHLVGTAIRCWSLRHHIERAVLWRFGLMSAAGGLGGALLNARASNPALTVVLALLLIIAGAAQFGGDRRWRVHGSAAWIGGTMSGFFGGLVGNQGGIRSAAMLGFGLPKAQFVATATAIGLLVDGARMPVYVFSQGTQVIGVWPLVLLSTIGVVAGTLAGASVFTRLPERQFKRLVGAAVVGLGIAMLWRGLA